MATRAPITFDQLPSGKVEIAKGLRTRPEINPEQIAKVAAIVAAAAAAIYLVNAATRT